MYIKLLCADTSVLCAKTEAYCGIQNQKVEP